MQSSSLLPSHNHHQQCQHHRHCHHGPLASYVKLWVAHAPGMPGTFSPQPRVSDPDMHHGTCVTHGENVPGACATGIFTFLVRCTLLATPASSTSKLHTIMTMIDHKLRVQMIMVLKTTMIFASYVGLKNCFYLMKINFVGLTDPLVGLILSRIRDKMISPM